MRVLALETSANRGSVAVLTAAQLLHEVDLAEGHRTARSLAPAIADLLAAVGWGADEIELVAVTQGPGSFTGLRIGVTTAKTLAYATGAKLVGINTLAAIAAQVQPPPASAWALIDAQRQQVFAARYRGGRDSRLTCVEPTRIFDRAQFISRLSPGDLVTGPGLGPLEDAVPASVRLADPSVWRPRAATVGKLAVDKLQTDGAHDLWAFAPNYFRKSAAEEKQPDS